MGGLIPREIRAILAERLYGPPAEPEVYAVEVRVRPVNAAGDPLPGADTVLVSGVGTFEPDDDSILPPAASSGQIVAQVEGGERFAHRIDWRADPRGVAYRATLEPPAVTLSAEQVAELRGLADFNPLDEWAGSDRFEELAAAVLRMVGGRA